jgi:hypothetical protein
MNTYRRSAAVAAIAAFAAFAAIASPASGATAQTDRERPCFIVQARWNTAFDGPAPTCPTPTWQASP